MSLQRLQLQLAQPQLTNSRLVPLPVLVHYNYLSFFIIEPKKSKTVLESSLRIKPQRVALDFENLS